MFPDARMDDGFTLVELMVALFVFAIIATTSTGFVYQTLGAKEQFQDRTAAVEALRLTRTLMKLDLLQLSDRGVRDQYGGAAKAGFKGGNARFSDPFLSLVRLGAENPGGMMARASLQRVSYALVGDRLVRRVTARLDPAGNTPVRERLLLEGVKSADIRFLIAGQWQNRMDPEGATSVIPAAVSLTLDVDGIGKIEQLFLTRLETVS